MPPGLLFASLFWLAHHCQYCHPGNSGGTWPGLWVWLESPQQSGHLQLSAAGLRPSACLVGGVLSLPCRRDVSGGIFILKSVLSSGEGAVKSQSPAHMQVSPAADTGWDPALGTPSVPPAGRPWEQGACEVGRTVPVSGQAPVSFIRAAPPPSETVVCMEGTLILCYVRQRQTTASQEQLAGFSSLNTEGEVRRSRPRALRRAAGLAYGTFWGCLPPCGGCSVGLCRAFSGQLVGPVVPLEAVSVCHLWGLPSPRALR